MKFGSRRAKLVLAGLIVQAVLAAQPVVAADKPSSTPAPGRYDGSLCVSTGSNKPQCGPVALLLQPHLLRIQVSDLVYTLELQAPTTNMRLVLMHGHVQIDEFLTHGQWQGRSLRFKDPDKDVRYEVRW